MKLKYVALALCSFSICFVCSSKNLSNNSNNNVTSQLENNNPQNIDNLTITFDLNGGTYEDSVTFVLDDVLPTSYWKFVTKRAPGGTGMSIVYPNHTFKGYSLAKDDSTIISETYIVKSNMTVYAQYEPDSTKECTVNWKDGNTILATEEYVPGDMPSFKGTLPTKEGYTFASWNPVPSVITDAQIGKTIDYSAVYLPSERVTLDYNNGGENLNYQFVIKNNCARNPHPTYTGYHIKNWIYLEGGTGNFTFDTKIDHSIKIQAQWEINTYTIEYVANGGAVKSATTSAQHGTTIATPTLEDRGGYDKSQVSWWTTAEFKTGTQFTFNSTKVESDLVLYAKWPNITKVTVTFNANGGGWDNATSKKEVKIDYGTTVYPPINPSKADSTFIGWYTSSTEGEGTEIDFSQVIKTNTEVFAHWKVTTNYTITFDSDGGSPVAAVTVAPNTSISEPDDPKKTGFTFAHWTVDGADVTFPYTVTANKTFKAVYSAKTYKVKFDPNGGTWSDATTAAKDISGEFNTMPNLQGATVSKGQYVFTGWKRSSDDGIGIIPFAAKDDTYVETYTAQWGGTVYHTVAFNSEGGSAIVSQRIIEGQTATEPATKPTRDGYTFLNWYKEGETATAEFDFTTQINEDITLHANWDAVKPVVNWYTEDGALVDTKEYTYNAGLELPVDSKIPAIIRGRNRFLFKKWLPNATAGTPVTEDMDFYGIYEENNVINFKFCSESFTIDGKSSFTEVFDYSDVNYISYTFDVAPGESDFALSVNDVKVESGYEYDITTGIINIDLHNDVFDKAITITLEAK